MSKSERKVLRITHCYIIWCDIDSITLAEMHVLRLLKTVNFKINIIYYFKNSRPVLFSSLSELFCMQRICARSYNYNRQKNAQVILTLFQKHGSASWSNLSVLGILPLCKPEQLSLHWRIYVYEFRKSTRDLNGFIIFQIHQWCQCQVILL